MVRSEKSENERVERVRELGKYRARGARAAGEYSSLGYSRKNAQIANYRYSV